MREMKHSMRKAGTALLSALFVLPSLAQSPGNVTLELNKVSLLQALQQLKSQTQARFVYSDEELRTAPLVTLSVDDASLAAVLDLLFRDQPYTYEKSGNNVYIIKPLKPSGTRQEGIGRTVRGKVVDGATGIPLIGASVRDPFSKRGTITAADGTFTLDVPRECRHLSVSFMGYEAERVALGAGGTVVVTLDESAHALDDVLVIGYGTSNRKDFTGSVATVNPDELKNIPALTIDDALAGKAAGVQVTKADGSPGGAVRIRVRGGSSLNGSVDPLYVIDGIPTEISNNYVTSTEIVNPIEAANYGDDFNNSISGSFMRGLNSLSGLNISDIESISILKDASATAIYGSKAANGVVIITTKRGRRGMKPQFDFNYSMNVSTPKKEKVLNGEQYISALRQSLEQSTENMLANMASSGADFSSYISSNADRLAMLENVGNANTDWIDLVTRTGVSHNVDFSVTGGSQTTRYYTSFAYTKQEGTVINTAFERYSGKISLDNDITSHFRMGTNISYAYTKNNITNGVYSQAISAPPILSPWNEDGTYANYDKVGGVGATYMGYQNPLAVASGTNQAKTYTFNGSVYAELSFLKDFKFKSTVSVNYNNYNQLNYIPSYVNMGGFYGSSSSEGGQGSQAQTIATDIFFENTLTYNKAFNEDHRVDAVLGTSWEEQRSSYFSASGKGYPDDDFLNNLGSASVAASVDGANPMYQTSLLSFYLRMNYVFKDRYLLTFTGRSDASSKFAKHNRVGYFPSGAIAWRISEEPFLQDVAWIDELKLRASIGKTGTQNISDHMFRTLYAAGAYAGVSALYPEQLGNDAIKWESTVQKDLGLDFSFFQGRLAGTLAYYYKTTDGALLNITPPPSSGYATITSNIAKIENVGVEFEVYGEPVRTKDWTLSISANISHNASKVLKLQGDNFSSDTDRNALNLGTTVFREGESLGLLCGRKAVGIITTQEQLDDYKSRYAMWTSFAPDLGIGSVELALDESGMYYEDVIGNCTPDFYGGFTMNLSYKNWSLLTAFTYSYGNDLIYQKDVTDMLFNSMANRGTSVLNASTPDHITGRPSSVYNTTNFLTNLNVYDASYLKLQSLSLSYSLPSSLVKKFRMNNMSIYATATNLFTLTSYPGPDPAVSDDPYSVAGGGRDVTSYPTVRSYSLGLRISF